jgi:hypothetical protein
MFVTILLVPVGHKHWDCILVICPFSTMPRPALEPTLYSAGTVILCRGIKGTEREPENSFPSSSKTEIEYRHICTYRTSVLRGLSTGAVTSSSHAGQHGTESSLGCRGRTEFYWIVDKYLPIDTTKYSRRLIFTTKIWIWLRSVVIIKLQDLFLSPHLQTGVYNSPRPQPHCFQDIFWATVASVHSKMTSK